MCLAVPKPADRCDMARRHFLSLGPSSNQDALLVYVGPKPPTICRRKRTREWHAEGQGRTKMAQSHRVRVRSPYGQNCFWEQYRERLVETRLAHRPPPPKKPFLHDSLRRAWCPSCTTYLIFQTQSLRHFPEGRHGLFDYGKLSQAHVFKLG
ncbi:hypothetical protein EDB86DRAFT_2913470, partial [Lactarius hatsudake]